MARRDGGRRRSRLVPAAFMALTLVQPALAWADADEAEDTSFAITDPIACKEVNGYDDYVVLPGATLTSDEKLIVYFTPRHFKSARVGKKYQAHFTQDGRVRRRGEKEVIWSKKNLLDYKPSDDTPPRYIYLKNTISLKGLQPGEYEFDIILRDEVGKSQPVVRSLPFVVVAAQRRDENDEPARPTERTGSR